MNKALRAIDSESAGAFIVRDQQVSLELEALNAAQLQAFSFESSDHELSPKRLLNKFSSLEGDARLLLSEAQAQQPEAMGYWSTVEQRLGLVNQILLLLTQEDEPELELTTVDLSELGLSYRSMTAQTPGDHFKVKLYLAASQSSIEALAWVKYCVAREGNNAAEFHIGLVFKMMPYGDRRALARHILQAQTRARHKN